MSERPISEWTTAELESDWWPKAHATVEEFAAEVLRLREALDQKRRAQDELAARADKAEAKSAEAFQVALIAAFQRDKAEADLAAARARLDDYEHMPCEECLTYAPGAEFAHLKAEKDAYMDRAFKAEAELAAARAELGHERELSKERYDEIGDLEVRLEAQEPVVDALWGLVERTRDAIAADPSGHPGTVPFGELVRVVDAYRQVQRENIG